MNASELRKLYISVSRLYGCIFSKELFELLDHYKIEYKKEQVLKDLKDRDGKFTREYQVDYMDHDIYLISRPEYDEEEVNELIYSKAKKPMYYPKTFSDLLQYSDALYLDDKDSIAHKDILNFFKRHTDKNEIQIECLADLIVDKAKAPFIEDYKCYFEFLELFDIKLEDNNTIQKYVDLLNKVLNNVRLPVNNGFTALDMVNYQKQHQGLGLAYLQMGENIKKDFLTGKLDPLSFLEQLEKANMPMELKDSMRKQLLEIIKDTNDSRKA